MDGDRARLDELFWRAADLAGDEREAFLSEACGEDPELRERIEALLAEADLTQDRDGGYLRSLARDLGLADLRSLPEPGEADEPPSRVGTRFGPYRTTKLLGRGGMGSVYQAERVEGDFEQRVAIKVVRRGMETGELSRRLRRERRILARLEHPNIARLFDGGIGEEGQPYLVLEYVEGERITDYCTHHALGLDERLRLFLDVARAVQFAHAKLVVHRDLKPSNVLVTPEGEVKLLDFGISKLLEDDGTEDELTRTGFAVLTPAYAAPEQIRGEEVTTATDVFALGVLLYELLSGRHPFRPNAGTDDRVADRVLEHDPGSPGPEGPVSTPRDLGLVCLNALRKEPERRYGSAADFARDIERCVAGEPVTARPPTLRYRASRFVGRHRVGVAASAAAVMALVVGLGSAVWQAHAAADEAARASRINEFVLDLFRASDPAEALGEDLTARDLLERGARRLERSLEDEPGVRAEMLGVLGPIYRELGLYDEAAPIAETALQLNREVHGEESDETTRALLEVARVARARASLEEADSLFRLVISRYEAEGRAGAGNAAIASGELGELALDRGETESAVELLERAVVQARAELSPGDPDLIWLELTYANALHREERWEEANEIYLSVAEQSAALPGGDDPRVATAVWAYGQQLANQGRFDEALPLLDEALEARRRVLGEEHPVYLRAYVTYAEYVRADGHPEEAETIIGDALEILEGSLGPEHPEVGETARALGITQASLGKHDEAAESLGKAVRVFELQYGPTNMITANALRNRGRTLVNAGRPDEAGEAYRTALIGFQTMGRDNLFAIQTLVDLGEVELRQGRAGTADSLAAEAVAAYGRRGRTGVDLGYATLLRARVQRELGASARAEAMLRETMEALYADGSPNALVLAHMTEAHLGDLLIDAGRLDEAEPLLLAAYRALSDARPPAHQYPTFARSTLRKLYERRGDSEGVARYSEVPQGG